MSNQPPKQRIQVPDSLRDVLLEFSIAYLLEQPGDVIDYAVEFFTKLQENRRATAIGIGDGGAQDDVPPSPDESIMSLDEGKFQHSNPSSIFIAFSPTTIRVEFSRRFSFIHVDARQI